MYKIDKNIPIPERKNIRGYSKKYPLDELEIGDSFFVPCRVDRSKTIRSSIHNLARLLPNVKIIIRATKEDGKTGLRVWRVEPK